MLKQLHSEIIFQIRVGSSICPVAAPRDCLPAGRRLKRSERSQNWSTSNWGQITFTRLPPRRQICPIYYLDLLDLPPALLPACDCQTKGVFVKKKEKSHKGRKPTTANQALINVGFCIKILNQSVQHVIISQEV